MRVFSWVLWRTFKLIRFLCGIHTLTYQSSFHPWLWCLPLYQGSHLLIGVGSRFPSESESRTVLGINLVTGFVTGWRSSYHLVSETGSSLRFILSFVDFLSAFSVLSKKKSVFEFIFGGFTIGISDLCFVFLFQCFRVLGFLKLIRIFLFQSSGSVIFILV